MQFKVIDKKGVWLTNPHQYPFTDPTYPEREKQVRFEPGFSYKVELTPWMEHQRAEAVLIDWMGPDDEDAEDGEKLEKAKTDAKAVAEERRGKEAIRARDAELAMRGDAAARERMIKGMPADPTVTASKVKVKDEAKTDDTKAHGTHTKAAGTGSTTRI